MIGSVVGLATAVSLCLEGSRRPLSRGQDVVVCTVSPGGGTPVTLVKYAKPMVRVLRWYASFPPVIGPLQSAQSVHGIREPQHQAGEKEYQKQGDELQK